MYLGIDAIADRDLGFAIAHKATATSSLGKSETQQPSGPLRGTKRMASPDFRSKREDNRGGRGDGGSGESYDQGSKRMRPSSSPPRGAYRDRESCWEEPSSHCRPYSPPPLTSTWDRDDRPRGREPLPPPSRAEEREEKPRQVLIPPVISWFVRGLPAVLLLHLMVIYLILFFLFFFFFWRG
jgi:cleavage stimulation factor subunit 3